MTEVCGIEGEIIILNDIFQYNVMGETAAGRIFGQYKLSRARPSFHTQLSYYGLEAAWTAAMEEADRGN